MNNDNINKIIEISNSISIIYNNLIKSSLNNNDNRYNEYLNYLELSVEVENNIYNELDITKDNYDHLTKSFNKMLQTKKYPPYKKLSIINRIENNIIYKTYSNPNPSNKKNNIAALNENICKICNRITSDCTQYLVLELIKCISTEKNRIKQEQFIYTLYDILYTKKDVEIFFLYKSIKLKDSRKYLLRHTQNKELIDKIYRKYIEDASFDTINILLELKNSNLTLENKIFQEFQLLLLKSYLKQTTKEEFNNLYNNFIQKYIYNNNYDSLRNQAGSSLQKVLNILGNVYEEKNVKKYTYRYKIKKRNK